MPVQINVNINSIVVRVGLKTLPLPNTKKFFSPCHNLQLNGCKIAKKLGIFYHLFYLGELHTF